MHGHGHEIGEAQIHLLDCETQFHYGLGYSFILSFIA